MVKRFSRFFRGGFIAVICAALQSQVFAFTVQLNKSGLVNGTVSMSKSSGVGGTDVAAHLESSGASATISAQANTGYEFEKWTVSITHSTGTKTLTITDNPYKITYSDFDSKYGADDIFVVQCTPTFKGKVIKVNLNANNSNAAVNPTVISVTVGGKYSSLSSTQVTAKGASFVGWFTTSSGGTKVTGDTVVTQTGEHTLYAHWQALSYNLVFDPSGGTLSGSSSLTVIYGDVYPDLPTASRTGYDFQGWYTGENGTGSQIKKGGEVAILNDSTLYAYWSPKNYTVSFNANGGSVTTTSKSVTYNSTYGDLPTPTRAGYSFNGWYTETSGGTQITSTTKVQITLAQTLYAQWTANKYTVEYDANGGTVGTPYKQVTYDATYGALSTPTRTGYTFKGWYTEASGGAEVTSSTKVQIVATQILYAHWAANAYTVQFDANGGVVTPSSLSVTYNSTYGSLPTPTRTGYTFKGWYTTSGGNKITSSTPVEITSSQTLHARWEANTYTVNLNANYDNAGVSSITVKYDSTYSALPTLTRIGYTFSGWYTEASGGMPITPSMPVETAGDQTLYAQWTAKTYAVYLNPNGGGGSESPIYVTYDSTYSNLSTPVRIGYTFKGWFTTASGGTEITSSTKVQITSTQTLYAQWSANKYTIEFDANGGSVGASSMQVTYDATYGTLPNPSRTGYTFKGWFTTALGGTEITSSTKVQITSAQTLYAQWSAIIYTIRLDGNGETGGATSSITATYDASNALTSNGFVREYIISYYSNGGAPQGSATCAYQFKNWNTEKNGTGTAYENGATVQNLLSENNGTIVLYAQWAAASVTLPEITLDDYSFKGWYTAESGGERIGGPGDSFTPTNNVTLYAQWSKLSYTVSFDPTGGEFVGEGAPIYVENEEKYPALPEVTRVGYGFAGWYLHGDIEIKEGDTVNITSNSWAYAVWTNNIYTVTFRKGEAFYGEEFSTNVFYDIPFELPKNSFECLDGSTFAGWRLPDGSLSSENTIVSNLATSGSVEIIATWEKPKDSLNASGACKNLYVTTILDDDYFLPWSVYEQEKDVLRSGSREGSFDSFLYALVKSPGRITFKWCATGAGINGAIEIGKDNSSMLAEFDGDLGYGEWKTKSVYINQAMIDKYEGWLTWHAWGRGSYATLYIKDVVWIPDGYTENDESVTFTYEDNDGTERTASVPKSWVDENNLLPTGSEDYKAALEASSGKIGSNGAALPYWYDYVAGTDPNDPNDIFRVTSISVTNGTVFLTWHPDLSSDALARVYKVLGKASLSDPDESWAPTNSASRFFRVDVHLKK